MRRRENQLRIGAEGGGHEDAVGSGAGGRGGEAQRRDLWRRERRGGLERHCFPNPESTATAAAVAGRSWRRKEWGGLV